MAVGKVGSFATVQPAIVDFGGMAQGAFKQIKEEEEKKKKAEEDKRKQELDMLKLQPEMDTLDYSGIAVFDENLQKQMSNYAYEFARLGKINTPEAIMRQKEINSYINNISAYNKSLKEGVVKVLSNPKDYNEVYLGEAKDLFSKLDGGKFIVEEGKGGIPQLRFFKTNEETGEILVGEDGKPVLEEVTRSPQSLMNIPRNFDITATRDKFAETIAPDITRIVNEGKGKVTEQTLFNDKRLNTAVDGTASSLAANTNSLASWWVSQHPEKPLKTNFSLEEKKEAKEWFKEQLKSTISEKYKEDPFNRGRGSGGKSDAPTFGTPEILSNVAGLKNVNYLPIIASGAKQGGVYYSSSQDIVGVGIGENGKLYPFIAASVGETSNIGSRSGSQSVGSGTSGKVGELKAIENDADREATLKRIAKSAGYETIEAFKIAKFGGSQRGELD